MESIPYTHTETQAPCFNMDHWWELPVSLPHIASSPCRAGVTQYVIPSEQVSEPEQLLAFQTWRNSAPRSPGDPPPKCLLLAKNRDESL